MTPTPAHTLRELVSGPGLVVLPGVTNAFDALLAERAGFPALFTTGAGIANVHFGRPDLGLLTMSEIVEANRRIADAVGIPLLADADTGYGNHLNAFRTVQELEQAGVGGLIIEDQVAPKKCGHFEGKAVIAQREMIEKLVAARRARRDSDLVLVARTDAIAVEGFDAAVARARAYVAAGADVVFVEAPSSVEQLEAIPSLVPAPCLLNIVEGGKTPILAPERLEELGYRVALYANLALRMGAAAVERAFATLHAERSSASLTVELLAWERRQETVGLSAWQELDRSIAAEAAGLDPHAGPGAGTDAPTGSR